MLSERDDFQAAATLRDSPAWERILSSLKLERETAIKALVRSESGEYARGRLAGRVELIETLLELAATAKEQLRTFGTQ